MYPYTLPQLPYAYDALEPHIDARTMEIHYTKHHQAYIDKLNKALESHPELQKLELDVLLTSTDKLPADVAKEITNQGGGHYNHSLFWQMMGTGKANTMSKELEALIIRDFGSVQAFKTKMSSSATSVFGSGWAWLSLDDNNKLTVISMPNQNAPIIEGVRPLLGLDVWEHAYYLKYQNRRADYIQAWWEVVNWDFVHKLYESSR